MTDLFFFTSSKFKKKVFDLSAFKTVNGTKILVYDNNGGGNQKFYYRRGYILPYLDENKCVSVNPKTNTLFLWERNSDKEDYQRWVYKDNMFQTPSSGKYISMDEKGKSSKLTLEDKREDTKSQKFNLIKTSAGIKNKFIGGFLSLNKTLFGGGGGGSSGGFSAPMSEEEEDMKDGGKGVKDVKFFPPEEKKPEIKVFRYLCCSRDNKQLVIGTKDSGSIIELPFIGVYTLDELSVTEQKWCLRRDGFLEFEEGGGFVDIDSTGGLVLNPTSPENSNRDGAWLKDGGRIVHKESKKMLTIDKEGKKVVLEEKKPELYFDQTFNWEEKIEAEVQESGDDLYALPLVPIGEDTSGGLDGYPDLNMN